MSEENMKDLQQALMEERVYRLIQDLRQEVTTLQAALTKAEAEAAVMRRELVHIGRLCGFDFLDLRNEERKRICYGQIERSIRTALSSTSGSKLLERMRLLEKLKESLSDNNFPLVHKYIAELDALQSKDTL